MKTAFYKTDLKLYSIVLGLCFILSTINTYAVIKDNDTKISLKLENITLKKALDTLQSITSYKFFYKNEDVNLV